MGFWQVWTGGYEWQDEKEGHVLVRRVAKGGGWRDYDPAADALLFQKFRRVPQTRTGILEFANRHGNLGGLEREPIADWIREIETVDQVWRLSRALERLILDGTKGAERAAAVAAREARRSPKRAASLTDATKRQLAVLAGIDELEDWKAFLDMRERHPFIKEDAPIPRDVPERARTAIAHSVNRRLYERAHVVLEARPDGLHLRTFAATLLGAVWYQLAQAMSLTREWRGCAHCGLEFPIGGGPDGRRKNSMYCSARCTTAAWRAQVNAAESARTKRRGAAPRSPRRKKGAR